MKQDLVDKMYRIVKIPKNGKRGLRTVHIPCDELKLKQRELLHHAYLNGVGPGPYAHAFCKGRSTRTNAQQHLGKKFIVRIDIKDFFPSVRPWHVEFVLSRMESFTDYEMKLVNMPYDGTPMDRLPPPMCMMDLAFIPVSGGEYGLPQGSPISPYLANIAIKPVMFKINSLLRKWGPDDARATIYADDITLSSDSPQIMPLTRPVRDILNKHGFDENRKKFRVMRKSGRQAVTGVVVNEHLAVGREKRKQYRAKLHHLMQQVLSGKDAKGEDVDWQEFLTEFKHVKGYFSYAQSVSPVFFAKYKPMLDSLEAVIKARKLITV
jgi:hypothetical protein